MSKFLRQMTALSKKPSDFQEKKPEAVVPPSETVDNLSTVDNLATVDKVPMAGKLSAVERSPLNLSGSGDKFGAYNPVLDKMSPIGRLSTVDSLSVDGSAFDLTGRPVNPKLCKPAGRVQDGHTPGEHAIYVALWKLGGTSERVDEFRDVTIGYDRLAAVLGGSKRNVQRLVESLVQKFAIEILRPEDSGIRQGKTYRIYSMGEIIRRRREAGYTLVLRNRSAVELIRMSTVDKVSTVDNLPTVANKTTETVDRLTTGTVDRLTTPLGSSLGIKQEASSSPDHAPLIDRVRKSGISLDDDAARRIISRCRGADHTATIEEIAHFAELKIRQLAKRRDITNWTGLLMAAIPAYFDPPATELSRYRRDLEQSRELERRQEIEMAQAILCDQNESESSKKWANEILAREGKTVPIPGSGEPRR